MNETTQTFGRWTDSIRHESAEMKILYREQSADGSVCYTIKASYYHRTREYSVRLDPQGSTRCTCRDGNQCWHQRALAAAEAQRTQAISQVVALAITEPDEWLQNMPEHFFYNALCGDYRTAPLANGNRVAWMALPEYGIFPGEQFNTVTMARRLARRS